MEIVRHMMTTVAAGLILAVTCQVAAGGPKVVVTTRTWRSATSGKPVYRGFLHLFAPAGTVANEVG